MIIKTMFCWKSLQLLSSKCHSFGLILRPSMCPLMRTTTTAVIDDRRRRLLHTTSITCHLMEFFDDSKNFGETEVKSGREWRKDELRIKSNTDLHKLWFVLYKERNMLKTMEEAAIDEYEPMPSPERIDKVEQSMKNLEEVVRERNKAYWELQVGEGTTGERPRVFRKDIFGRLRWIGCSEHLMPYKFNTKWRSLNAPGFGKDVIDFTRRLREKQMLQRKGQIWGTTLYVRNLLRRFPDIDIDYLQELYPDVNIKKEREHLDENIGKIRNYRFHSALYKSKQNKPLDH
ncbi:39S ribosomal protein L47, mitochondrial-like [Oppia nitens]|uniref:39S ribosomal protein L47, mitochondrial-like n=1 Tax=Oppia nitens TaxID=1686743 RepID=UPI0023DB186A|nr:39S ribosomal protein L47, mitochondrial-like [Oppia nitens]